MVDALQTLCARVQLQHPHARIAVHQTWWKKARNVSATFFGARSQDGAEVVLAGAGPYAVEGELYVERSLVAELAAVVLGADGAVPAASLAAVEQFLAGCEQRLEAHLRATA